jgi:UDP-N-acetylmuramoylalanine--D-glutamate ligase
LDDRHRSAQELANKDDVQPNAPHNIANALAAAALARAFGVSASAIKLGLEQFEPAGHRIATVATIDGVTYIDDSKATNTHAALTSLRAYSSVVWIAGGMAKGQDFSELIVEAGARMRGVVLLGVDRGVIAQGLARHAAQVPVKVIERNDTEAMVEVVAAARALAQPGDTVLLAPGCASWDMFRDYAQRGELFAQAVQNLGSGQ